MFRYGQAIVNALVAVALVSTAAPAQSESADRAAFVTVVGQRGEVMHVDAAGESRIAPDVFSREQNRIGPGERVRTTSQGSAALVLPAYGAVVYLEGSSELRLMEPSAPDSGVSVFLLLTKGRAAVIRRSGHVEWLLVAAEAEAPGVAGYTLSKGASLFVEAGAHGVTFAARAGNAWYYAGPVPAGALIDASGEPADQSGVQLPQGQRISTQAPPRPVPDGEAGMVVPPQLDIDMWTFARAQGNQWLEQAERGDFTPVRGAARAAPEMLRAELEPSLKFDQPRPVLVAPAARAVTRAIQAARSPAQTLVESDIPGTVIAAQRFRRSRIIGSPGTTAGRAGALTINRAAELPIRLRRD